MELLKEDKAILAHVVIDPDAWVAHAVTVVGEWAVTAKIEKYRSKYLARKDDLGYKTRAKVEAELSAVKR